MLLPSEREVFSGLPREYPAGYLRKCTNLFDLLSSNGKIRLTTLKHSEQFAGIVCYEHDGINDVLSEIKDEAIIPIDRELVGNRGPGIQYFSKEPFLAFCAYLYGKRNLENAGRLSAPRNVVVEVARILGESSLLAFINDNPMPVIDIKKPDPLDILQTIREDDPDITGWNVERVYQSFSRIPSLPESARLDKVGIPDVVIRGGRFLECATGRNLDDFEKGLDELTYLGLRNMGDFIIMALKMSKKKDLGELVSFVKTKVSQNPQDYFKK